MRQAILFLTNKSNEWTLRAFHALEDSMRGNADVYILYHQQGEILPASLSDIKMFPFTSSILHDMGYTPIEEGKLVPGSNHFPLLKFFKENQGYDYYWLVEDDVRFSGEWKNFFEGFSNNDADFLSSYVETKTENPDWFWWPCLKTGEESMEEERLLKSFNPIYRLSRRALTCIDEHLRNGWSGHHEAIIPTLLYNKGFHVEDFGGKGSFVREGNDNKFYDSASMDIKPLLPDGRKDYLFHPVKEEKVRKGKPYKKNAVFVAAGKDSLHRQLLKGEADFDLHLLIYDGSYNKFCDDSDFICCQAGYKMDMTYHYIHRHPEFLERYEYFFLMDDDIEMPTEEVNKLFRYMRKYQLKIAQPSLVMSYYTYEHTLHNPLCVLRYTNFVEMMIPCFSREALIRVLPTFEEKVRGCGIEFHWPVILNNDTKNMAIIDAIKATHTRSLQPWAVVDESATRSYLGKNNLSKDIKLFSCLIRNRDELKKEGYYIFQKSKVDNLRAILEAETKKIISSLGHLIMADEILPLSLFFFVVSTITEKRRYLDISVKLLREIAEEEVSPSDLSLEQFSSLLNDSVFQNGRLNLLNSICMSMEEVQTYSVYYKLCGQIVSSLKKHLI